MNPAKGYVAGKYNASPAAVISDPGARGCFIGRITRSFALGIPALAGRRCADKTAATA